ncbi:damage-inducible protein DinB [Paenibacillus pini]|uniref:Nuclease inhibitor n=2 Tax=Paenibacillus TaxID=44249 RepID=W7YHF5_9BACL|nr:DinB family protein [Paenibacillus pini]GAF10355.1 nuclease inhibitor [Paenibacillus pini JCM 16418]
MYNYHVWANELIINRIKELPREIYHQETLSGYPTLSKVLAHLYFVEYAWFEIISGKSMNETFETANQMGEQLEAKDIEEMEILFNELSARSKQRIHLEEDMERIIIVDNPYAGILNTTPTESVLHVVTHGSYHRGNIATMLRQLGHTSVMQDYGLYLYSK